LTEEDRAEIASLRIDVLLAQGKEAEAKAALERFKGQFPKHRRVASGSLEVINRAMAVVLAKFDQAGLTSDDAKVAQLRSEAQRLFKETVQEPLDAMIADLNDKLQAIKKAELEAPREGPRPAENPERDRIEQALFQSELSRLKAYIVYARRLEPDSKERQSILEKGLEYADRYVSERYEYPVMQYDGQLQRGILAYELGNYELALEHLSLLYDISPPWPGPYEDVVANAFKNLRLQSILFGARAAVQAGRGRDGVSVIKMYFLEGKPGDPLSLTNAEADRNLRQFAVLVTLEYGVAQAAMGRVADGLETIQSVIAKYSSAPEGSPERAYVNDARQKLGDLANLPGVTLRGADLYEAAIGLKSQKRWNEALGLFRKALSRLDASRTEDRIVIARCLNEIGEISFVVGRFMESTLAYHEVYRYFQDAPEEVVKKVARNFVAAVTKTEETRPELEQSPPFQTIKAEATKFSEAGDKSIAEQLKMTQAGRLEDEKRFEEAREIYQSVLDTVDGDKNPYYWRAQASAARCLFQMYLAAEDAAKEALATELDAEVAKLGETVIPGAQEAADEAGAASGSLVLGQILFTLGRYDEASEALEIFHGALAEEKNYRCLGLGYKVLADSRLDRCEEGRKSFLTIYKLCKDDLVVGIAALTLSDCYNGIDDKKSAALFLEAYLKHPASADDKKDPSKLIQFARLALEGERFKLADVLIQRVPQLGGVDDADLARQLTLLEGTRAQQQKNWKKVVELYQGYVERYDAKGDYYEDPYVLYDLARAHIESGQPKPDFKDYELAERNMSAALVIMKQRADKEPSLKTTFYKWAYFWCRLNQLLGNAGEPSAFGKIILFADNFKHTDMGGLKDEFLKLREDAEAKQSRLRR
jgi:tetratricopeptide (TPR) repeat protein